MLSARSALISGSIGLILSLGSCEKSTITCPDAPAGSRTDENGCQVFIYRDESNGTTLIATPEAEIGTTYELNGQAYLVVDSTLLYNLVAAGGDLTKIVTSRITNMHRLLAYAPNYPDSEFDQDISTWDVSQVTDMSYLFFNAGEFNRDLSPWDVRNVTNMEGMFWLAERFNQDLSTWNVSNVTNMNSMFKGNWSFDQDLGSWTVSQVTNCAFFRDGAIRWRTPQPYFQQCPDGSLSGDYTYHTSDIWCNGGNASGTVSIFIRQHTGQYSFSDWSFGAYSQCYGGGSAAPGDLAFTVIDGLLTFNGATDGAGDIWEFTNRQIIENDWQFDWRNTYGESATVTLTFPGGVPFRVD